MALRVKWSDSAIQSFEEILEYIEQYSFPYAKLLAKEINLRVKRLVEHPLMGREVPEFPEKDYREIIYRDYRIIYRVRPEVIEIGLIYHGARMLEDKKLFF